MRKRLICAAAATGFLSAGGCSSGSASGGQDADAGDGAEGGEAPAEVVLPVLTPCPEGWRETTEPDTGLVWCDPWPDGDPVTPPQMTPCPDGWREVTDPDTGTATCDPWPGDGPDECAEDEAHFPGEPGCTRIGTPCTDDEWAAGLPTDAPVLYVGAGAGPGGEGTRESPYGTIGEAMAEAETGTVIALSKGAFDEEVLLAGGVTLWGACVAETIVARSDWEEYAGTITLRGRGALRNLRIGGRLAGIWATNRGRVIDVQDVVIAHAVDIGWLVGLGATATGRNVVIRDTESNADRMFGRALDVNGGSQLELSRAVVRRNREVGIGADGAETRVVLSDIAVSDTVFQESDEEWGEGLAVSGGATVEVTRGAIEHNQDIGVYVLDEGTTVLLADVVVRDTQANEGSGWYGIGLDVERGARAEVTKGLFERNREAGVTVIRDGSIVVLTDVVVRDTMGRMTGGVAGRGLNVQDGAEAHVTRAAFERNREHGILAGNEGTTLTLEDVVVRDTLSQEATPEFGRGLIVQEGARAEVARALFQGNREGGIVAHAGAEVTIEDVVVRDTLSREGDGKMGRGLHAEQGAQVEVARALLEGNREASVLAGHEGTSVQMEDVVVRNTLPAACEDESCPGRGGGSGVVSLLGATVELTRFVVTGSAVCGVQLASGGAVDLHHGAVFGNEVCGVNVQDVEFDIDRLFDDVLLYRNGLNLDTTEWPLPDPGLSP